MPPRRPRAGSNAGNHRQKGAPRKPSEASPMLANASPNLASAPATPGMSDAARYEQNLKVLRIRDDTILKIIDQFSHVCLYDHNGTKWEKRGFEGSMFLVERESEPRYGFYILNRESPQDVNEAMYPEDDVEVHGQYLMYRSYPEYTKQRMARIRANNGVDPAEHDGDDPHAAKKSTPAKVIGLWMFQSGIRESLADVMVRLHSYIVKGLPYPEEYHHGVSGRPHPIASAHLGPARVQGSTPLLAVKALQQPVVQPPQTQPTSIHPNPVSELDTLFSRLGSTAPTSPPRHVPAPSASTLPASKQLSLSNLFNNPAPSPQKPQALPYNPPPGNRGPMGRVSSQHEIPGNINSPTTDTPVRGLALLDSMFASASASDAAIMPGAMTAGFTKPDSEMNMSFRFPRTGPDQASPMPPTGYANYKPGIISPKPIHSTLPEVLSFEQVTNPSVAYGYPTNGASQSLQPQQSGQYRYDGDNRNNGPGFDRGAVLDEEAQSGALSVPSTLRPSAITLQATPRPAIPDFSSETPTASTLNVANLDSSVASTASSNHPPPNTHVRNGPSFEDSSDLWMGGGPLDDRSSEVESEVIELDFADISALSDPSTFAQGDLPGKRKGRKGKKGKAGQSTEVPASPPAPKVVANGHGKKGKQGAVADTGTIVPAAPQTTNGVSEPIVHPEVARTSLLDMLFQQPSKPAPTLSKNDFIREVLTLIHTDKSFGEKLYADYVSRA